MIPTTNVSFLSAVLLLLAVLRHGEGQTIATFNLGGVTGTATFSLTGGGTVKADIVVTEAFTSVEIRSIWVDYSVQDKCGTLLGAQVTSVSANIGASSSEEVIFNSITSLEEIEGMSIVLISSSLTVCARIEQQGDYITAAAHFKKDLFGTVYFRRNAASTQTIIVSDLYIPTGSISTGKWMISASTTACAATYSAVNYFNPGSSTSSGCGTSAHSSCPVGALSLKVGNVPIGSAPGDERVHFADMNLPLSGSSGINGYMLIIYNSVDDSLFACTPISVYTGREGRVSFSRDGVTGSIAFSQASPLDVTKTNVNLQGLASQASGYHVHDWQVPIQVSASQSLCSAAVVSGHLNPFQVVSFPAPGVGTDDQYEIGDLSSKYGTLAGDDSVDEMHDDTNLPLYGRNSIIGRSVVIHRDDATGSRWMCANIEPQYSVEAAVAVFKFPVIGHIAFLQAKNQPDTETSIFVHLDYNDGRAGTTNHLWMVNTNQAGDDLTSDAPSRCQSTGTVYNPFNLGTSLTEADYNTACTSNADQCRLGDMSGKLGTIGVRNTGSPGSAVNNFFTDLNLPLSGTNSIVGRSVVIMNVAGTEILSCATIIPLKAPQLVARFTGNSFSGSVTFNQLPGTGARSTTVANTVSGLANNHRFNIQQLPPSSGNSPCSSLGSIYNPLSITPPGTPRTDDQYEVGNLARFGIQSSWMSTNLPLTGFTSIMGRSLVIVDSSQANAVMACAEISTDTSSSGVYLMQATVNFVGNIVGTAHLSQTVYADGAMSDTSVVVDLMNSDNSMTPRHNWHVHVTPVNETEEGGICSSAGPHYDPFKALATNSDSYNAECGFSNPLRCELGDQSNKLGTYDIGSGRMVSTDDDLPLIGTYSVQGRSVVFHVQDRGAARLVCADIIPVTTTSVAITIMAPAGFDKREAAQRYATAISAKVEDIVVQYVKNSTDTTDIRIYFTGLRAASLQSQFVVFLRDENNRNSLGLYAPQGSNAEIYTVSALLIFLTAGFQYLFI